MNTSENDDCNVNIVKLCKVCGDKALGFNFNGLSCESCKAFFRRNAVKQKKFACRKNNECQIDKTNRKRCKRCRLDKCYAIGMKKELIWCYKNVPPDTGAAGVVASAIAEEELDPIDEKYIRLYINNNNHHKVNKGIKYYNADCDSDNSLSSCAAAGPSSVSGPSSSNSQAIVPLRPYEMQNLLEVHEAMKIFSNDTSPDITGPVDSLLTLVNLPGLYIKKVIKFCKGFEVFRTLTQDDQLIALKSNYTEFSVIRHAFVYELDRDGFPMIQSEHGNKAVFCKVDTFNEWKRKDLAKIIRGYIYALQVEMENDEVIRDLILAQLLFNVKSDISCPEFVRYQYTRYCHLLQRYLEHKYKNVSVAHQKYSTLMHMVDDVNQVSDNVNQVYRDYGPDQLSQVLGEIYNLL